MSSIASAHLHTHGFLDRVEFVQLTDASPAKKLRRPPGHHRLYGRRTIPKDRFTFVCYPQHGMFHTTQSQTRRAILAIYHVDAILSWKANQISRHAAAALMSSRSPLAASPLTTLLVSPLTSFLLGPCFNVRSSTSLLGGLLNCIGVFGNVVRSS